MSLLFHINFNRTVIFSCKILPRVEKDKSDIQRETEDMKASLDDIVRAKVAKA